MIILTYEILAAAIRGIGVNQELTISDRIILRTGRQLMGVYHYDEAGNKLVDTAGAPEDIIVWIAKLYRIGPDWNEE